MKYKLDKYERSQKQKIILTFEKSKTFPTVENYKSCSNNTKL